MIRIEADRRSISAQEEPEAEARLRAIVGPLRDAQFQAARDFARVEASAAFRLLACASIGEYAAAIGFDPLEGRDLTNLGNALRVFPELEAMVRRGEIAFRMACALGRIVGNPRYLREGDDWLSTARCSSWTDLQRKIRERIAEVDQDATGLMEVSVWVRSAVKSDFERCRRIASDKAGTILSRDQAFVRVVDHYLDSFDPERRHARAGRAKDAEPTNVGRRRASASLSEEVSEATSRYLPASTRRELRQRSGGAGSLGRCEFPGCRCQYRLQHAHVIPKRRGGGQEPGNLFLFCPIHHLLFDAGLIQWVEGTIKDPVFEVVATGERVRRGKARAPPLPSEVREGGPIIRPATSPISTFALN